VFFLLSDQRLVHTHVVCPAVPYDYSEECEWDRHSEKQPRVVRVLHRRIAGHRVFLFDELGRIETLHAISVK
jgi:hypothetical protein